MAVAHSAASESHTGTTGSTSQTAFTWTHTQTGTPQGVLVFVHVANSGGNPVSSVTYGGVTLERVSGGAAIDGAGELGRTDLFFAGSGLPTGNQTVTVNRANTTDIMYASAATVTAATNTNVTGIVLLQGDGALTVQSVTDGGAPTNSLRYAAAYSGLAAPPPAGTGSTLLNSIDFGNYGIALVRETTAGSGARNVGFNNATTDDRAAVHVAVRELWNRTDTETVGAFTLTGNDATLTKAAAPKVMDGGTGAFTLTGQPADLRHNPDIEAGTGAFALAGQPADTRVSHAITGETGVFTFTGQPATPSRNITLDGGTGVFTLAGQPAVTLHSIAIDGGTGAFTFTGNNASLTETVNVQLSVGLGEFTVGGRTWATGGWDNSTWGAVGENASLLYGHRLSAEAGSFGLTGQPATLADTDRITAETGTFTLSGNQAAVRQGYALAAATGTFTTAGQPATLLHNSRIEANIGSFALSGGAPALLRGRYLSGGAGEFIETGQPVTFRRTWAVQAATGAFIFTGHPAGLTELGAYEINAGVGAFSLTGQSTNLAQSQTMPVGAGTFTLTGQPAATVVGHAVTGETGKFFLPERNLHQRSEEFNNAYWSKANSSVTANSTTAPDGTLTADTLIENTANTTHIISRNLAFTAGVKYTASLHVKTYQNRDVALVLGPTTVFGGTGGTLVVFSPSTNTILLTGNSPEAFGAIDVGNGWYRIYVTKTAIASATASGQIQLRTGTTGLYTGDGTSGAYIWGAQWQEGDLDNYDPTGAAAATPATLLQGQTLAAEVGSFVATGQSADTKQSYQLSCNAGGISFAGNNATLIKLSAKQLLADVGVFAFTPRPATLALGYTLNASANAFALTGNAVTFTRELTRELQADAGIFNAVGQPAGLRATYALSAQAGQFIFNGNQANFTDVTILFATNGAFVFVGQNATLNKAAALRRRNILIF